MMKTRMWKGLSGVAVAAFAVAACVDAGPTRSVLAPSEPALGNFVGDPVASRTAVRELLKVCKDYAAGSQAPDSTDFTATHNAIDYSFKLGVGSCRTIWINGAGDGTPDVVTVTETVPAGFTAAWVKDSIYTPAAGGTATGSDAASGNTVTTLVGGTGIRGATIVFTNTPIPEEEEPGVGRFTGGGSQTVNGEKVKIAFTIHCDIKLSNNIEINWGKNKWHIDKPITKALCLLDPAYNHPPPVAPLNTFIGEATGRLNGVDGSNIWFTIIDDGEPGKNDMFALKIVDAGGATILDIPLGKIESGGNFQAHYDQPHGNKPTK